MRTSDDDAPWKGEIEDNTHLFEVAGLFTSVKVIPIPPVLSSSAAGARVRDLCCSSLHILAKIVFNLGKSSSWMMLERIVPYISSFKPMRN